MTQTFNVEIDAHIAGSEAVFVQPDFRRKLIAALQALLQAEAVEAGLTPQEAYEAYSVIPGADDHAIDLQAVIRNLVASEIKRDEAPCSASTHFNSALAALVQGCPAYRAQAPEHQAVIDHALGEVAILHKNFHKL